MRKNHLEYRDEAMAAAKKLAGGNLQAASAVVLSAEIATLRTLVARVLPGGEAEYWRTVREEIDR